MRKTVILIPALLLLVVASAFVFSNPSNSSKVEKNEKLLRHVVLFKFKDGTTPAQTKEVEDAFRALPSKTKVIKSLEWGTNNSPENLAQGFTHCFFVTFASEKDREVYLPHPDHKAFGKILGPHLDKVLVVDYWAAN